MSAAPTTPPSDGLFREHIRRYLEHNDRESANVVAERALALALPTALAVLGEREVANDVAQDTAIQVLAGLHRLRRPEAFPIWVHRITTRRAVRAASGRRARFSREAFYGDWVETGDAALERPDVAVEVLEAMNVVDPAITRAIRSLPVRQRVVVALRYVHDLPDADIAEIIGARVGTVGALLSRARSTLRAHPALVDFARREGYLE